MSQTASNTAVSGLNALSTALSNSAKNIVNSETPGFKASQAYFISQVTGNGGNASAFSAGGVTTAIQQQINQQGLLKQTNSSTDLAILGNGFMVVATNATGTPDIAYTRAGSFSQDVKGNLVNPAGNYLMGWPVDQYGNVAPTTNVSDVSSLTPINVSNVSGFAKATTSLSLGANLPSDLITAPLGKQYVIDSQIFDSLGESYTLQVLWTKTAVGQYTASLSCPQATAITKATSTGPAYGSTTPLVVNFNSQGEPISFDGASTPPNIYITWNSASTNAAASNISLNLGTVGTLNGITSLAGDFNISIDLNDGEKFGNFNGVTIDDNGIVSAFFDNGTTLPIYRAAMANFQASNGLQAQSGNIWTQTTDSGKYVLAFAKSSGFGRFASSNLESSTVDLASELTGLIGLQHAYSANTHVIQTDTDMFKTLLQIHA